MSPTRNSREASHFRPKCCEKQSTCADSGVGKSTRPSILPAPIDTRFAKFPLPFTPEMDFKNSQVRISAPRPPLQAFCLIKKTVTGLSAIPSKTKTSTSVSTTEKRGHGCLEGYKSRGKKWPGGLTREILMKRKTRKSLLTESRREGSPLNISADMPPSLVASLPHAL